MIGGGPVGLALAVELGGRGVRVTLAERNARGGHAPRAKTTNIRTRTHFRRWGLADRLAQASPLGVDYPYNVMFVTRLGGYQLARIENGFNAAPERADAAPEHAQWIPQYKLEGVLRDRCAELPSVDLRFGATFEAAEQGDDGVTSRLQTDDGELVVRSRFLVGADGPRSVVRESIGATMEGQYGLSRNYNVVFRAPGADAGATARARRHVLAGERRRGEPDRPHGQGRRLVLHAHGHEAGRDADQRAGRRRHPARHRHRPDLRGAEHRRVGRQPADRVPLPRPRHLPGRRRLPPAPAFRRLRQ